ncbi:MAG: putative quinol monooxygenase [Hymenobacter sp.]
MSTNVRVVALLYAKPGQEAIVRDALLACVGPSREEDGNIMYTIHLDSENPALFIVVEHWESRAVRDQHTQTAHFKKMQQTVDGEDRLSDHTFHVVHPLTSGDARAPASFKS